ncbi:PREDICTED: uncharacterized protein LOC109589481 [Amphimedon queenslandica]|uniref:Uncharacterized protein n=1 Tax=Amphimedon queenslandica TaxID=400682 RepID=A0A1X7VXF4_AMPQE|nr:PREDICTED: uncharacterized protein LOC109589481 [Amphimedon queenslandica]|eukprot:XP_019861138.1 PREDICTED: uncharacterized protein LOC109589481 [Amphimedon queenslandica]
MKYFIVLLFAVSALAMPDPEMIKEAFFDDELIAEETVNAGPTDSDIQATDTPIEAASSSLTTCLNTAINSAINAKLADQPVIKVLNLEFVSGMKLKLSKVNGGTLSSSTVIEQISIGNGYYTRKGSYLAYQPRYSDYHSSGLAGIFLNLEKLFPCIARSSVIPVCGRFTYEEDGFLQGKSVLQTSDLGNHIKVFGSSIATYGMAISGCRVLNGKNGCLPLWFQTRITCLLPRSCK